jgi:hypothetical protein
MSAFLTQCWHLLCTIHNHSIYRPAIIAVHPTDMTHHTEVFTKPQTNTRSGPDGFYRSIILGRAW